MANRGCVPLLLTAVRLKSQTIVFLPAYLPQRMNAYSYMYACTTNLLSGKGKSKILIALARSGLFLT